MRDESGNSGNNDKRHDTRFIDLAVVLALLAVVTAAYAVIALDQPTPRLTSRIVPSQTVRW